MDRIIDSEEQLKSFLARAYWLETKMERAKEWIAFLEVKTNEAKDVLFQITRDSDNHKETLQKLILKIKGFDLDKTLSELVFDEDKFSFKNKMDEEIFQEIYESEKKAFDVYTMIRDNTDKDIVKKIWKGSDSDEFFRTLNWLVSEEKRHMVLVEPYSIGNIQRIQ